MMHRSIPACMLAELLGTFLLVFFGCGSVHVAVLTGDLAGLWQVGIVWGLAIMVAIYTVGAISGAHINPAITLGLAGWRLFPWSRVVPYIGAQLLGAFAAAAVLFALWHPFLTAKENAKGVVRGEPGSVITAMCYGEYFPNPGLLSSGAGTFSVEQYDRHNLLVSEMSACLAEVIGTAILAFAVVALTEGRNPVGPKFLAPVFIGLTVAALICVIAPLTQACFNPARDFGPRLFAWLAGWGSVALPGPRGFGFATVYLVSPVVGSLLGVGLYQVVLQPILRPHLTPEEEL